MMSAGGGPAATDIESDLDAVNLSVAHRYRSTSPWTIFYLRLLSAIGLMTLFHRVPACSRSMNFWIFPVEVLGSGP